MEISKQNDCIRVKTKNATIIVDPGPKSEGDAFLYTQKVENLPEGKVCIYGPGEFEVAGVGVKGERAGDSVSYDLLEENRKILVLTKPSLVKDYETEEYNAIILKLEEKLDDAIMANISSEIVILYGDEEQIAIDKNSLKRTEKINLKKTEEFKGFTVYLGK